jgi:hypothetical protein
MGGTCAVREEPGKQNPRSCRAQELARSRAWENAAEKGKSSASLHSVEERAQATPQRRATEGSLLLLKRMLGLKVRRDIAFLRESHTRRRWMRFFVKGELKIMETCNAKLGRTRSKPCLDDERAGVRWIIDSGAMSASMVVKKRDFIGRPFDKAIRYPEQRVRRLIPEREMPHLRLPTGPRCSSHRKLLEDIPLMLCGMTKWLHYPRSLEIPRGDIVTRPVLTRNHEAREPLEVVCERVFSSSPRPCSKERPPLESSTRSLNLKAW